MITATNPGSSEGTQSAPSSPATPSSAPGAASVSPSSPQDLWSAGATPASEPSPGGQGEPAAPSTLAPATQPTGDPASTPGAVAPITPPPVQTPPPFAGMTPEQIANLAAQTAAQTTAGLGARPQQQQAPTFTQADFDRTFNVTRVDENTFTAITGYKPDRPEQVAALNNVLQGLVRQAVTMSNFQLEQAKQEFQARFNPVADTIKQQTDTQIENEFFTTTPHLRDFQPLVREATNSLGREGKRFNSKQELFKAVTERVNTWLGRAAPQPGSPGQPQQTPNGQQPPNGSSQRQMTPTSMGGQVSSTPRSVAGETTPKSLFG